MTNIADIVTREIDNLIKDAVLGMDPNADIDIDDVIRLEFSMHPDIPGRYQTSDGKWHTGVIPSREVQE